MNTELTVSFVSLSTQAAMQACMAAITHAESLNIAISVSVVDRAGLSLAAVRMNHSPLHSPDIAQRKAYTAVSFGKPTKQWQINLAEKQNVLMGLQSEPNFTFLGGGLPIESDHQILGAIGISGGSEQQDIECAMYALESLMNH